MEWQEVSGTLVRGSERVACLLRFATNSLSVVELRVGEKIESRGEGQDLFEALATVRRDLERSGARLDCNGSRREVFPSVMLRQSSGGRFAYVLSMPRTAERPPAVDILAPAPDGADLVTVAEQQAYFNEWSGSPLVDDNGAA
jgi:hypothetical protein